MNRIALVVGCVWSLCSWAQDAFAFRLPTDTTQSTYFVPAGHCSDTVVMSWVYALPVSGTPTDSFQIWASTQESCGDVPSNDDVLLSSVAWITVASVRTGTFEVPLSSLFDGGTCPSSDAQALICGSMPYVQGTVGGSTQYAKATGFIVYDPTPPAAPVITNATPGSDWIDVEFVAPIDAVTVTMELRKPSQADFQPGGIGNADAGHTMVGLLQPGVEYRVRLIATDAAGNESEPSNEVSVTPVVPDAGVPDDGDEPKQGCTTAPGLFVALAALWLRRRNVS